MEFKWIAIMMAVMFGSLSIAMAVDKHGQHQIEIAKIQQEKCK